MRSSVGSEQESAALMKSDVMFPLPYVHSGSEPTNRSSARVRSKFIKMRFILLFTNLIIRALNTVYFKNVSINLITDANQRIFVCDLYSGIRDSNCNDVQLHTVQSIYQRTSLIFHELLSSRTYNSSQSIICFNDRYQRSILFSFLLTELAIRCCLPTRLLPLNNYHLNYNYINKTNVFPNIQINMQLPQLHSTFYTNITNSGAIPLVAHLVALPDVTDDICNIELSTVLPETISQYYSNVSSLMLPIGDVKIKDFKNPTVYTADRNEYLKLLHRLKQLKMIEFTSAPKCINGAFGVEKDENKIRLIIDCTNLNAQMVAPPTVRLPNASHLSNISSTNEFFVAKLDLSNYYHQLRLPTSFQPYFCLPAIDCIEFESFNICSGSYSSALKLYPMLTTLAMGWTHSVFIAQSVHEHVLYVMYIPLNPINNILVQSVLLTFLHLLYIDDLALMGYNKQKLIELINEIKNAYERVGLKINIKKCVEPTMEPVKVLGIMIHGRKQRMMVAGDELVSLQYKTLHLLHVGECTSNELSILVGHWVWFLLLKRPLLSILQRTYKFIQQFRYETALKSIWITIQRELTLLCCLCPLLSIDLNIQFCDRVVATDASLIGFGVMSNSRATMTSELNSNLLELSQHVGLISSSCAAVTFEQACDMSEVINSIIVPTTIVQPIISLTRLNKYAFDRQISTLVSNIQQQVNWITIMSGQWKFNDQSTHINELELNSILLAVRWLSTLLSVRDQGRQVIMLVDNSVSIYSLRKGRSSSMSLLKIIRRISCLCLAMDLVLKIVYIPSKLNPADAASRIGIGTKSNF